MAKYRYINAGKLRHRVTIQRATKTQNSYGEDVLTWADLDTFPAWVSALQGREFESMAQRWAEARFMVEMRYQPDYTFRRADRIYWEDSAQYFDVLDVVDPDGRQVALQFICKEFVS